MSEIFGIALPLKNPTLIFGVVMAIILLSPLIFKKLHIPSIIGLILAGVILGPYGLNLLAHDESFNLFGRVGLLYIMFLSGIEIDINDFKKNRYKSIIFGMYTFLLPMGLGILSGMYILNFSFITSTLLASMYASHTLMTYPIVSRYGVAKSQAVNITIGGTIVTVTLSLIILAAIAGIYKGTVNTFFWIRFILMTTLFCLFVLLVIPRIASWFFKRFSDSVLQYSFVLATVALASFLAELVGMEGILGAFLVGLSLNKLIPNLSPLMSRINFVGNALFIPFFLISVGMLVDVRVFANGYEALLVAFVMTAIATLSKWLAAWAGQKTFGMNKVERDMIFGLSNAQAAATLAAVMIGYNIILPDGSHLLNENVLNGTIVMILVTCLISSIVTEKAAQQLSATKEVDIDQTTPERILIPLSNPNTCDSLMELAVLMKEQKGSNIYALSVMQNEEQSEHAKNILERAVKIGAATDNHVEMLTCIDLNPANGIRETAESKNITDIVIGLHERMRNNDSVFGAIFNTLLKSVTQSIYIYHKTQPINTIKRILVAVPAHAERESGFLGWYDRLRQLSMQMGAKVCFYANEETTRILRMLCNRKQRGLVGAQFNELNDWEDFLVIAKAIKSNDMLVVIQARKATASYHPLFAQMPKLLEEFFINNCFIVIYPRQDGTLEENGIIFNTMAQSPNGDFNFIRRLRMYIAKRKKTRYERKQNS